MAETDERLRAEERASIEALVEGVRRRSRKARRSHRRGWGSLAAAAMSLPVLSGALDGSISLSVAVLRLLAAFVLCRMAADVVGSLTERYQMTAAVAVVTDAVAEARARDEHDKAVAAQSQALTEAQE